MPCTISLSSLSFTTPDGLRLLDGLDLVFATERTGLVGRNGVGKTTLFNIIAGRLPPSSGAVRVTGTTGFLAQIPSDEGDRTLADLFGARAGLQLLADAEAGRASADALAAADWMLEERLTDALEQVRLSLPFDTPLAALSGGQRTRAGLAALIEARPDFLLLDEPTNNLDAEGRQEVIDLLGRWRGGAIVVSHDRELLERMDAIVELTSLGAVRHGGNWSSFRARKALALENARHDLAVAQQSLEDATRGAQRTAERQARRDGGGRRKRAKGDAPRILLDAAKERSEATAGGNARLGQARVSSAQAAVADARARIEVLQPLSMTLASTHLPEGRQVLRLDGVCAGYGGRTVISGFSLAISGPRRVAIAGPNGCGKTTLLRVMTGQIAPCDGTVLRPVRFAMLDQSVGMLDPALSVRDNFRRINPGSDENGMRAVLARFLFRGDSAMQAAGTLSGGQTLRAGLACVLGSADPPPLLFLDEPTNHLDTEAVEALEAALRAYDGALVAVSHDRAFLDAIGIEQCIALSGA